MTQTTIRVQMAQREDTAANWTSANPILLSGEIGYENDTTKLKIGDGTTNWNSLAYHRFEPVTSWTLTANGTTDYIFSGTGFAGTETDPDLYVVRGQTYKFINAMGAHPFQIQSTQGAGGTAYNDGITNNAVSDGTLTWEVRMDAPSTLYYQCTTHALMAGVIYVLDEGSAVSSIDNLSDVDTSTVAPTDGQALVWDNTAQKWEPGTVSGGGGATAIDDLSDVDTSTVAPTNGQVLTWDGSQWEPATPTTSGLPTAQDGEALIYENGQWVAGPVIGGVNYIPNADADFSSVELLLLGNGTNGSTTITDSSNNALTVTANGNAQISTTQSKFGGASIYFDGTGDYLSTPNQSWMAYGTNEFTIECWFYINANSNADFNGLRSATLVSNYPSNGAVYDGWILQLLGDGSTTGTGVEFYGRNSGGSIIHQTTYNSTISHSTWHHVAVVRETTAVKIYLNGTEVASTTLTASDSFAGAHPLYVATNSYANYEGYLNGYIDDLRITSGVARYTANFTPPTAELPTASGTAVTIPYSIDKLDDVDTSTVAPTDGQALVWDNTAQKWEPGTVSGGGGSGISRAQATAITLLFS